MLNDILPSIVDGFTANILAYAVLLAAVATITMALLELTKAILRLRMHFHRFMIKRWLEEGEKKEDGNARYNELVILALGKKKDASALLDQPTDKLMGQIQSASNVALEFPEVYPHLYSFLTDVRDANGNPTNDSAAWKSFSKKIESGGTENDKVLIQQATQARARLDHFTARKLDAFQTQTEYFWARLNQTVAIAGSAAFILMLLLNVEVSIKVDYSITQKILLASFGGMLAPFAKDVVAALSNLRTK